VWPSPAAVELCTKYVPRTRSTTDTEVNAMRRKDLWMRLGLGMVAPPVLGIFVFFVVIGFDDFWTEPYKVVDTYLEAVQEDRPLADLYGTCATPAQQSEAQELLRVTKGLDHKIVTSSAVNGDAFVNINFSSSDSAPSPYFINLQKEGEKWKVCGAGEGHYEISTSG
jgi:hypothetical protein